MFYKYALPVLIFLCCLSACKKKAATPTPVVPGASLSIVMRHHGSTSVIDSAKFYIASLATYTAPSFGFNYMASGARYGDRTIGIFTGLRSDSIYIYGRAYDTALHTHIDAGIKYKITAPSADTVYLDMADTSGTYPIYLIVF